MEYYGVSNTEVSFDDAINNEGNIIPMWKPSDCKTCTFAFCPNCDVLQVTCNPCEVNLILEGHMGFALDGTEHSRNAKTGEKKALKYDSPIKDKNKPRFDVSDMNRDKLRCNIWKPCGNDENLRHFWRCPSCEKHYKFGRV